MSRDIVEAPQPYPPELQPIVIVATVGVVVAMAIALRRRDWMLTAEEHRHIQINLGTIVLILTATLVALTTAPVDRWLAVLVGGGAGWGVIEIVRRPELAPIRRRLGSGEFERVLIGWAVLMPIAQLPLGVVTGAAREWAIWASGSVLLVSMAGVFLAARSKRHPDLFSDRQLSR